MPSKVHIGTGEILEGQDAVIMHRLYMPDGNAVTQSNTTGDNVTMFVFDMDHPTRPDEIISTQTFTRTSVIYNNLQTDGYWTVDGTGYNFRCTAPYETNTSNTGVDYKGGHRYRHEFQVTSTSPDFGEVKWVSIITVVDLSAI